MSNKSKDSTISSFEFIRETDIGIEVEKKPSKSRFIRIFTLMFFVFIFAFVLNTAFGNETFAAAKTWDGGGLTYNWDDAANWGPDGVPTSSDDVTIDPALVTTININQDISLSSLNNSSNVGLEFNGYNLSVAGAFVNGGGIHDCNDISVGTLTNLSTAAIVLNGKNLTVIGGVDNSGGITNGGIIDIGGNLVTQTGSALFSTAGMINVAGNTTVNSSSSLFTSGNNNINLHAVNNYGTIFTATGSIVFDGALLNSGGDITTNGGDITIVGATVNTNGGQIVNNQSGSALFSSNVENSNSSQISSNSSGNITIVGNLLNTSSSTISTSTGNLNVGGSTSNNATITVAGSAINLSDVTNTMIIQTTSDGGNINITGEVINNGLLTTAIAGNLDLVGSISCGGSVDIKGDIHVTGDVINTSAFYATGKIQIHGGLSNTGAIGSGDAYDFQIDGDTMNSSYFSGGHVYISGNLTLVGGIMHARSPEGIEVLQDYNSNGGNLSVADGTVMIHGAANNINGGYIMGSDNIDILGIALNDINSYIWAENGEIHSHSDLTNDHSSGIINSPNIIVDGNLINTNSSSVYNGTADGNITVYGSLENSNGSTLYNSTSAIGNIYIDGSVTNSNGSQIFNGGTSGNIIIGGAVLNTNGGQIFVTVTNGNISFGNNVTNSNSATISNYGTGITSVVGDFSNTTGALLAGGSGNWDFDGSFSNDQYSSVVATSGLWYIAKDFTNNMTNTDVSTPPYYLNNNGTVIFDTTSDANIGGTTVFYNLTSSTPGKRLIFQSGATQTVLNNLTLAGSSTSRLRLVSSNSGSQWYIDPQGAVAVTALDVYDSNNLNDVYINPSNSVDRGNTLFWFDPALVHTVTSSAGVNGSISPLGTINYSDGASQTYSILPSADYHIEDVLVDGSSVGTVSSYNINNINKDYIITVIFAKNTAFVITPDVPEVLSASIIRNKSAVSGPVDLSNEVSVAVGGIPPLNMGLSTNNFDNIISNTKTSYVIICNGINIYLCIFFLILLLLILLIIGYLIHRRLSKKQIKVYDKL